jgi:hypothetical protein
LYEFINIFIQKILCDLCLPRQSPAPSGTTAAALHGELRKQEK